jgi:hypothetical protein
VVMREQQAGEDEGTGEPADKLVHFHICHTEPPTEE